MSGSALIDIVRRVLPWLRAGVLVRKDPTNLMPVLPGRWVHNMDGRRLLSTPPVGRGFRSRRRALRVREAGSRNIKRATYADSLWISSDGVGSQNTLARGPGKGFGSGPCLPGYASQVNLVDRW